MNRAGLASRVRPPMPGAAPGPIPLGRRGLWLATRAAVVVVLLAVVQVGVQTRLINPLFVATPTTAIAGAARGLANGTLGGPMLTTLYEVAVSLVISSVAGLAVGYLLWRFTDLGRAYEAWVAGLFAAPLILLYPIPLVIFGRTTTAVIAQATVMALLPVILYTRQGLAGIDPPLLKVAAIYRLRHWQALRHVFLPAAAPTLVTGLRLGLTYILVGVVSVEYLASIGGLGKTISFAYLQFNMAEVYSAVVCVFILAAVLLAIVGRLQWMVRR